MPNFKPYNHDQSAMVVINFQDQLQSDTFEYTLHHLISDKLDLSVFYPSYNNETGGRAAYDPAILLRIILFAYSKGITSSREIQWNCENNIIFKALSCDSVPHWTTIASFVSGFSSEIEALFEQVVLICDQQGLLGKELFAIDQDKKPSYTDWMKNRVDSQKGKEIYSHRMSVVEPVFGNIGTNKGLNRFSLRGKKKVQGQWNLFCLVHNIEKLANYGNIAA